MRSSNPLRSSVPATLLIPRDASGSCSGCPPRWHSGLALPRPGTGPRAGELPRRWSPRTTARSSFVGRRVHLEIGEASAEVSPTSSPGIVFRGAPCLPLESAHQLSARGETLGQLGGARGSPRVSFEPASQTGGCAPRGRVHSSLIGRDSLSSAVPSLIAVVKSLAPGDPDTPPFAPSPMAADAGPCSDMQRPDSWCTRCNCHHQLRISQVFGRRLRAPAWGGAVHGSSGQACLG